MVEGGWPPSLHPSQPASCLLLDIPQLGSVPWAQPLLSCPPTRCRCRHSSGIWVTPDASVSPLGRSWKTPTRCPEMGGGRGGCGAEKAWLSGSSLGWTCPFSQAPKPGAAHRLATGLANHRLGYLPQTGASLLPASCSLTSDISFICLLLPPQPAVGSVLDCGLDTQATEEVCPKCLGEGVLSVSASGRDSELSGQDSRMN